MNNKAAAPGTPPHSAIADCWLLAAVYMHLLFALLLPVCTVSSDAQDFSLVLAGWQKLALSRLLPLGNFLHFQGSHT